MLETIVIAESKINKLSEAISDFENDYHTKPYLFANISTIMMIFSMSEFQMVNNNICKYYKYSGCKLYIDDDLPFGSVRIR